MSVLELTSFVGIVLFVFVQEVSGSVCLNGQICDDYTENCCGSSCCPQYSYSFWNLWYFWFVMFIIMMSCCGMCSYAKRRQYYGQQHNQIIIPGRGRMTNVTATTYPVGVAPPPMMHASPQPLPPQAHQSPPPYSEVTSKPDLYPAYQGPPYGGQMPYPTQQYAYPPQPHMYPPQPQSPQPQVLMTAPISGPPQPPPYVADAPPPSAPSANDSQNS